MNVQVLLIQAGIELAREVIHSPITKKAVLTALCRISDGSLCPLLFDFHKDTWKMTDGSFPTVSIQASDKAGDETTLSCSVEFLRTVARHVKSIYDGVWGDKLTPPVIQMLAGVEDTGEQLPLPFNDAIRLESLSDFEEFLDREIFSGIISS